MFLHLGRTQTGLRICSELRKDFGNGRTGGSGRVWRRHNGSSAQWVGARDNFLRSPTLEKTTAEIANCRTSARSRELLYHFSAAAFASALLFSLLPTATAPTVASRRVSHVSTTLSSMLTDGSPA